MQVDPREPKLKLPGSKRLKLECGLLLSNFAFKINLCRCIKEALHINKSLSALGDVISALQVWTGFRI